MSHLMSKQEDAVLRATQSMESSRMRFCSRSLALRFNSWKISSSLRASADLATLLIQAEQEVVRVRVVGVSSHDRLKHFHGFVQLALATIDLSQIQFALR